MCIIRFLVSRPFQKYVHLSSYLLWFPFYRTLKKHVATPNFSQYPLNARFEEHLRSVEEKKHLSPEYQDHDDINVPIHFNLRNHSIDDMEISALLFVERKFAPVFKLLLNNDKGFLL